MKPVVIDGDVWTINRVPPASPLLVDRTGNLRPATTDPLTRMISISDTIVPPLFDMVLLHEVTHAITISHGLLYVLRSVVPSDLQITVEEWSAELMEKHAAEAFALASESLGRPLCIKEYCIIAYQ